MTFRYAGRKKLSRMYFFILHLSIADLITAIFSVLPQLAWEVTYRFYGENILCKFVKFSQTLGPYLSSYILMATAVDRHQAICYPLTYCSWTSRRSKVMVYAAWITSLIFCLPQVSIVGVILSVKRFISVLIYRIRSPCNLRWCVWCMRWYIGYGGLDFSSNIQDD